MAPSSPTPAAPRRCADPVCSAAGRPAAHPRSRGWSGCCSPGPDGGQPRRLTGSADAATRGSAAGRWPRLGCSAGRDALGDRRAGRAGLDPRETVAAHRRAQRPAGLRRRSRVSGSSCRRPDRPTGARQVMRSPRARPSAVDQAPDRGDTSRPRHAEPPRPGLASGSTAAYGSPTSSSYTAVIRPQIVVTYPQVLPGPSPACPQPRGAGPSARFAEPARRRSGHALPVLPPRDSRVVDSRAPTTAPRSVAAASAPSAAGASPPPRPPPHGGQAQRRHRAVQPRQGVAGRAQGVPGPPGDRGRPRAARPARRGGGASQRRGRDRGHDVGLAILGPLRDLDEVAYLRFASVYRAFEALEDFEAEITLLRAEREAGRPATPARRRPADSAS